MSLMLCFPMCLLLVAVADGTSSFQDARGGYMFLINTDKNLLLAVKDDNCYFVPLSDLRLSSYSAASFSAAEDHVIEMLTGATPAQVTLTSEVEMMSKYDDLLDDVMCRGKTYFEYRVPGHSSAAGVNGCSSSSCLNGGRCLASRCVCMAGYTGTNCQTDIDNCSPNPCLHGGRCRDGVNSYSCICASGYSGARCETGSSASYPASNIRLVGSSSRSGRVEVFHGGSWGTVCDDNFDTADAKVVCRQLGFSSTYARVLAASSVGDGGGDIVMDEVNCSGSEQHLTDCTFRGFGVHDCTHKEDVGVSC